MDGNEAFHLLLILLFIIGVDMIVFGIFGYIGAGIALILSVVVTLLLSQPRRG